MPRIGTYLAGLIACLLCGAYAWQASAASDFDKPVAYEPIYVDNLKPEAIPSERVQRGLSVVYYLDYFERHLDMIPTTSGSKYKQVKGKPILELNQQFGENEVFDSGTNRGVALRLTGYLHIAEAGDYQFQALSNDGVRVVLAGKTVISDPEQHSDRLSNIGHVTFDQSGYYPLIIEYFQRKGTAALELFWKTGRTEDFVPVPENVYVHLP